MLRKGIVVVGLIFFLVMGLSYVRYGSPFAAILQLQSAIMGMFEWDRGTGVNVARDITRNDAASQASTSSTPVSGESTGAEPQEKSVPLDLSYLERRNSPFTREVPTKQQVKPIEFVVRAIIYDPDDPANSEVLLGLRHYIVSDRGEVAFREENVYGRVGDRISDHVIARIERTSVALVSSDSPDEVIEVSMR